MNCGRDSRPVESFTRAAIDLIKSVRIVAQILFRFLLYHMYFLMTEVTDLPDICSTDLFSFLMPTSLFRPTSLSLSFFTFPLFSDLFLSIPPHFSVFLSFSLPPSLFLSQSFHFPFFLLFPFHLLITILCSPP